MNVNINVIEFVCRLTWKLRGTVDLPNIHQVHKHNIVHLRYVMLTRTEQYTFAWYTICVVLRLVFYKTRLGWMLMLHGIFSICEIIYISCKLHLLPKKCTYDSSDAASVATLEVLQTRSIP